MNVTPPATAADLAAVKAASDAISAATLNAGAPQFTPATPGTAVGHVAVKLPAFWTTEPELWFLQAESVFRQAKVKCSLTKYDYVLQQLPCEVLVSVKELARRVRTGVVDDPYEQLEAKLTASFQKSPWQKTFELLDMPDLGDRRPSALMDAMLALLPEDVPPNRLFLALFLRRLPEDMRNHLAAQDLATPEAMAAAANRLFDARPQGVTVATVATVAARPSSPGQRRSPSRQGRQGRDRRRRPTPGRQSSEPAASGLCFYHDSFGARAVRCRPPCSWSGNGQPADGFGN
jgi:hypothetical protein